MLRRYWLPIAGSAELTQARPTKRVRVLGEELVLFRDLAGTPGLIQERCPHQRFSLSYGMVEADGIRCGFHGWKFDRHGVCVDQPIPMPASTVGEKLATAYPVAEQGGLVFAYLGAQPTPPLPRLDALNGSDLVRHIGVTAVPENWVKSVQVGLADGDLLFPFYLRTCDGRVDSLEIHVPIDNTHTYRVLYRCYRRPDSRAAQDGVTVFDVPWQLEDDERLKDLRANEGLESYRALLAQAVECGEPVDHSDPTLDPADIPLDVRAGCLGIGSPSLSDERVRKFMPPPDFIDLPAPA